MRSPNISYRNIRRKWKEREGENIHGDKGSEIFTNKEISKSDSRSIISLNSEQKDKYTQSMSR